MATPNGLEAFTLYLDPNDPEDIPIIRYLKPKVAKKRAASEIRRAMLLYMEYLKGGNAMPVSQPVMPSFNTYQPPAQLQAPPPQEKPASTSKAIQEARRSFMKK